MVATVAHVHVLRPDGDDGVRRVRRWRQVGVLLFGPNDRRECS